MALFDDGFPLMLEREAGMRPDCPEVAVAFGLYPVINPTLTKERGHEVYDDVAHIKIAIPNEQKTVVFAMADATYKRRFPQAYAAFLRRQETGVTEGLPLQMWPPITKGQAMTLIAGHILTVEALSQLSEEVIKKFPDWVRAAHDKAKVFLKMANDTAAASRAQDEKKALTDTIASLQEQINQLQAREVERQQKDAEAQGGASSRKTKAA